jgi:hypothetical protein
VPALVGLYVSRYLAGYQLEHLPGLWDPFFAGAPADPRNGTEEIVTSWVSTAFPVSDAALGGYTYLLEILTGMVGSRQRWRTMPWLVLLFGLMIVPLGMTTIAFIVIQPVVLGTWSTLALVGAESLFARRAAGHVPVPAPPRQGGRAVAAGAVHRRHRRNAHAGRCQARAGTGG